MITQEGELPGSDSKEDTSNWVARVGRKKAAGEEEATHKGEHTEEQNTQPATGSRKQNAKRRQLKRREHNTQGGTKHRRRNTHRRRTLDLAKRGELKSREYTSSAVLSIFMFEHCSIPIAKENTRSGKKAAAEEEERHDWVQQISCR